MTQGRHDVRYRGLDGIKGLALVAVVLYHTVGTALPGGYVGVDMFLTVSGFLAGTGLLGVLRRERRLRPLSYWRRRLARIAPPLALVVMASAVLARVLQPDLLVNTRRQALSALTFWLNWNAIASGASYFDSMNPQLFQHLWYVSVQMQLYLVAPLLPCALTRRFGRRRVVGSLTCLAAVSALAMAALYSPANPTRVYEGTDTHAVGFLLGMALATVVTGPSDLREPVLRHAPVAGGAAFAILVLLARFLGQGPLAFRGGIFLAAVCSMALVAGAVGGCPWLVRLLETRPLALLGRHSYAVYLCHWPVWLLVSPLLRGLPDVVSLALALALTAASSVGCERLVGLVAQGAREVRARVANVRPQDGAALVRPLPRHRSAEPREQGHQRPGLRELGQRLTPGLRSLVGTSVLALACLVAFATAPAKTSLQVQLEELRRQQEEQQAAEERQRAFESTLPAGQNMDAVGDSVMLSSLDGLNETFPGITVNAEISRNFTQGTDVVRGLVQDGTLRHWLVLGLGTNNVVTEADLDQMRQVVGDDTMLVLVGPHGPAGQFPSYSENNDVLRAYAANHPDNTLFVDWDAAISAHPDYLWNDGIHPVDETGGKLYAQAVSDSIAAWCEGHGVDYPPVLPSTGDAAETDAANATGTDDNGDDSSTPSSTGGDAG